MTSIPKKMPRVNLNVKRGDTVLCRWRFTSKETGEPLVWDGYQAAAQVRVTPDSDEVLADLDVSLDPGGVVTLRIDPELSRTLPRGSWDLEITEPNGDPSTVFGGRVLPTSDTTRPEDTE